MAVTPKDLGLVSAYGAALEGGYTGTYDEYKEKMLELLNLNLSTLGNEYDDTEIKNRMLAIENADYQTKKQVQSTSDYSEAVGSGYEFAPYGLWFCDKPAGGYDANGNLVHSWQDLIDEGYLLLSDDLEYSFSSFGGTFKIPWKKYLRNRYDIPPVYTGNDIVTLVVENHEWYPYIQASLDQAIFNNWRTIKQVVFKNGIIHIPNNCFNGCNSLERVYLPDSVETIGDNVFVNCGKLYYVRMPRYVKSIGDGAFSTINTLNHNITNWFTTGSVGWPIYIKSLSASMFRGSQLPKNTIIPFGITTIKIQCFQNATNVETVTIPNTVTSIGKMAFYGCTSLVSINIPDSVTSIGEDTFTGCTKLTTIKYKGSATGAPWGAPNATIVS